MEAHVNNMNTIKKLEILGYEGVDVDLATSLFEYGMVWRVGEVETVFIYGIEIRENNSECEYGRFDRCSFVNETDVEFEFDWAAFPDVHDSVGATKEQWSKFPLTQKICDLRSHYGFVNVFGPSNWTGFEITE